MLAMKAGDGCCRCGETVRALARRKVRNSLPSLSEHIYSNKARKRTTSPDSWFSAFCLALESCVCVYVFFPLPQVHRYFHGVKDFKYNFQFFPYQENQQHAVVMRAPCWFCWTHCVNKGCERKQHLWEHFETIRNYQRALADGTPLAHRVLKFPDILQDVLPHV